MPPRARQATIEVPTSGLAEDHKKIKEYVKKAIQDGNMLYKPGAIPQPPQHDIRKALIIAPVYQEPGRDSGFALPATVNDVKLVHEMLIDSGYKRENIRILCDMWNLNCLADPTRQNIMDSLEWLVHDSRSGDYRFLHFSGHGIRDEKDFNDKETRKAAAWVHPSVNKNTYTGVDPKDFENSLELTRLRIRDEETPKRVRAQNIPKVVKYYKQAIMTRLIESRDDEDSQNPSVIWDSELNQYLSKLHPESTITCLMDCCASGRMLNLPHKALGAGFRGPGDQDLPRKAPGAGFRGMPSRPLSVGKVAPGAQALPLELPLEPIMPPATPTTNPVGNLPIPVSSSPQTMDDSTESAESFESLDDADTWSERLPFEEKQLNKVKANIFHWSGCHQRQNSHNSDNSICATGALTRAFTNAYKDLKSNGTHTHRRLHKVVKYSVYHTTNSLHSPRPQFVQLWTVFKNRDREARKQLLRSQVEL